MPPENQPESVALSATLAIPELEQSNPAVLNDESTAAGSRLLAFLLYGRYSLGRGAVSDSACTIMPVTRHPPAFLIA